MQTCDPRVEYVDSRHEYSIDGVVMPSVSQIIKPICGLDRVPQNRLDAARMRGTYVHQCIELALDGTLDRDSVHASLAGYFRAFERFQAARQPVVLMQESITTHVPLWYAGRVDLICNIGGQLWLIDFKTSNEESAHYGCQLAGYEFALKSNGIHIDRRACLYLRADGSWSLIEYDGREYLSTFLACLSLMNWRKNHG